jgi:enoyl-CoA hydratase
VSVQTYGAELSLAEPEPGIAILTLNRPERLNALSWSLIDDLHAALGDVAGRREIRILILTGTGRGFCSGLDISDDSIAGEPSVQGSLERQERVGSLALVLRNLPQPVIAAVNGPAAGGGLALALASDVRVSSATARFNVAFVRVGLSGCDVGVSYLLPRVVGAGVASELMLTGRLIDADEALRIGLVTRVVPPEMLESSALEIAGEILANSPFGVRMTKQVLRRNCDAGSLEAAIELENRTQVLASQTSDLHEALNAFRDGRAPAFEDN